MSDLPRTCMCDDPDIDRLHELIAAGYTQREASLFLWDKPDPGTPLYVETLRREVRMSVRTAFAAAFPWLRLPTTGTEAR